MIRKIALLAAAAMVCAAMLSAPAAARDLRIATEGAYPPFNSKNAKGELVGFDVDLARAICAQMKAKCTLVAQDWGRHHSRPAGEEIRPDRRQHVDHRGAQEEGRLLDALLFELSPVRREKGQRLRADGRRHQGQDPGRPARDGQFAISRRQLPQGRQDQGLRQADRRMARPEGRPGRRHPVGPPAVPTTGSGRTRVSRWSAARSATTTRSASRPAGTTPRCSRG